MPRFLHVGCGRANKSETTAGFNSANWTEIRLDIDPAVAPDIVGDITNMAAVADGSVDAVFSSHNIEHLYPHDVPLALQEFRRVLAPDGFLVITCPDLQSVARFIAAGKLTDTIYNSPAGPIAPIDILYGYRPRLAQGDFHMAHRCGFTQAALVRTLQDCGFPGIIAAAARDEPFFDLWAVASKRVRSEKEMRELAAEHFPSQPVPS